tara:strand:+ start:802 stop:1110 length:309 start_codon:yes stop_codon:yes gene_type:complete
MNQKLPVKVTWPPALANIGYKRWAISGSTWIEVPPDTTRDDLDKYMVWDRPKIDKVKTMTWEVEGSKGNTYKVTFGGGHWSCTCPGFKWRNSCKHIEARKKA